MEKELSIVLIAIKVLTVGMTFGLKYHINNTVQQNLMKYFLQKQFHLYFVNFGVRNLN